MEDQEYLVQRKVITWEQVYVVADSFDQAIEQALADGGWDEAYDQSEATDTYWVKNVDTEETKIKEDYYGEWEDGI
jgi:hypothetical protein